jgi:hypothetical protein
MVAAALAVSALLGLGASAAWAGHDKRITVVVKQPPVKTPTPAKADPLSIAGGTDARTVPLRAANAALLDNASTRGYFEDDAETSALLGRAAERRQRIFYGRLQLIARNAGKQPIRVRARLWRAAPPGVVDAPQEGAMVELLGDAADTQVKASITEPPRPGRSIGAGDEQELRLVFVVPGDQPPSAVEGSLVLEALPQEGETPLQRIDIPIKGAAKPIADVVLEPEKAVVQVTTLCPDVIPGCANDDEIAVRLRGNGAAAALRDLRLANPGPIRVLLRHDGQREHAARLEDLRPGDDPAEVMGTLRWQGVDDAMSPGTYTGAIVLSRTAAGAPSLPAELRVRQSFLVPLLLIAAGVLLSRVLFVKYALRRRRRRAQHALQDTIDEYGDKRGDRSVAFPIWTLDAVISEQPVDEHWKSYDDIVTSGEIAAALKQARSDEDIEEAEAAVLALRLRVLAWLSTVQCVSTLEGLKQQAPPDHDNLRWQETRAAVDSATTLDAVEHEPATPDAAAALRSRVMRQVAWRAAYQGAWVHYGRIEDEATQANDQAKLDRLRKLGLHELDKTTPPAVKRTGEEQSELLFKLGVIVKQLGALSGQELVMVAGDAVPDEARAAAVEMDQLLLHRGSPRQAIARRRTQARGASRDRTADSVAETGWKAKRAAAGRKTREVPVLGAIVRKAFPEKLPVQKARRWLWKLRGGDLFMTALVITISSAAYALTIYDQDWGSPADAATAFCAGVVGTAAISWAALPIFQSLRLRAKPPSA